MFCILTEPIVEPILPHCDPILVQFMSRPVSVMLGSVDDDRLTPAYWLSAPPVSEEADQEMEQVRSCLTSDSF